MQDRRTGAETSCSPMSILLCPPEPSLILLPQQLLGRTQDDLLRWGDTWPYQLWDFWGFVVWGSELYYQTQEAHSII